MSELDDAIARLDRAVARLETAPRLNRPAADGRAVEAAEAVAREAREGAAESARTAARLAAESAEEDVRIQHLATQIVTRVEAALDRIGQALREDG